MKLLLKLNLFVITAVLAACGGGGGDTSAPQPVVQDPPPASGGVGRTGIFMGPISNFGSIIVNGVRYDTDEAEFEINDDVGSQADLAVGMIVIVEGSIDDNGTTGKADRVIYDDAVKGPIDSIDAALNELVVLGQTVAITADTSFDDSIVPASLDGLSVGDIVEVSGQIDADGRIVATRIELKPAGTQFELHGTVSNLDTAAMTFSIGNQVVDYSTAMLNDFVGQITEGDLVEAKGTSFGSNGELIASSVEFEDPFASGEDGDEVEIEGFITRFDSAQDFDVAGFPVITNGSTTYEGGSASDLGLNVKVEVEGSLNANGVIVADEVDIRRAKAVRATARLDSVDTANNSVVLLDITIKFDALTRLEDKSDADIDPLTINDLAAGDYVEVRGEENPVGSGEILASIFERLDPDTETILQGFVETVTEPSFTTLGVTIQTNGSTVFRDEVGAVLSATEFFGQLTAGDLVKAKGTESSVTTITAEEVSFETEF